LSTDCEDIASVAEHYQLQVPFIRPDYIAQDSTPMLEVIRHTLDFFADAGERFDTVVLLQPTCPFRKPNFIDECIQAFYDKDVDCLFSAKRVPHEFNPHWVFEENEQGLLDIATHEANIIPSRQLLPNAYVRDGSVYVFKATNLLCYNSIYGKRVSFLESPGDMHVNIDTPDDWNRAEWIVSAMGALN
jgi:CMP-N,N'-diacetyllegionaminic acid synthase